MIKLVNVDIHEFSNIIYPEYVKIFPKEERKPYKIIESAYIKGILKIIKILDDELFIGFIVTINNDKYVLVDYFAILPQYQDKGYGTKAIELLKEKFKNYQGLLVEVEKEGLGKNEQENKLRRRRSEFYKKLGFLKLNVDWDLYNVIFTLYVLPMANNMEQEEVIIQELLNIYISVQGKERTQKNCKVIGR